MVSKQWTPSNSGANLVLVVLLLFFCTSWFSGNFLAINLSAELLLHDCALFSSNDGGVITSLVDTAGQEKPTLWPNDSANRASNELNIDMIMVLAGFKKVLLWKCRDMNEKMRKWDSWMIWRVRGSCIYTEQKRKRNFLRVEILFLSSKLDLGRYVWGQLYYNNTVYYST